MADKRDRWRMLNTASSPAVGNDLNGMKIEKTLTGYKLSGVLATVTTTSSEFSFTIPYYDGQAWTITVSSLTEGGSGNGTWTATPATVTTGSITGDPTDGDFTAQAGGGADEDAAEEASSAGA